MENQSETSFASSLVKSNERMMMDQEEQTKSQHNNNISQEVSQSQSSSQSSSSSNSSKQQRKVDKILRWLDPSKTIPQDDDHPPLIKNHTMTFFQNKLYIFGGYDSKDNHKDLYEFNLKDYSWKRIQSRGQIPSARNGHTASLYKNRLFVLGGWLGSGAPLAASDIYQLDLLSFKWSIPKIKKQTPGSFNMHTADFIGNRLFVFRGGDGKKYLNDLHVLDVIQMEWLKVETTGNAPPPRANHSSAVINSTLYIFGGWDGSSRLNDFYQLDTCEIDLYDANFNQLLETMTWSEILTSMLPTPRAGTTLTPINGEKLFLFGGSGHYTTYYNDILIYDTKTQSWSQGKTEQQIKDTCRPAKRAGHSVALYNKRKIFVYGGSHGQNYMGDICILDTDAVPIIESIPQNSKSFVCLLKKHYDNPMFSDITIKTEGKYFNSMFATRMKQSNEAQVEFPFDYTVMASILKFIYTQQFDFGAGTQGQQFSLDSILEFLDISNYFLIERIKRQCELKLIKIISPYNIERIQQQAARNDANKLIEYCKWYKRCQMN